MRRYALAVLLLLLSSLTHAQYTTAPYTPLTAKADAVNQSTNVTSVTVYAVPAAGAGTYRVSCYAVVTTAATTSSTLPNCGIGWTDNDSGVALLASTVTPTNTANAAGAFGQGVQIINAKASSNITYQTSNYASSGATAMQYAVHVKVEYVGP